ncbi:HNH endonuclease, partial [Mycolicibacterium duvalii]
MAENMTVAQLRTAVKVEPQPAPAPRPQLQPQVSKRSKGELVCWTITLSTLESATFEAGLASQHDGLIAEWKRDHAGEDSADDTEDDDEDAVGVRPPMPTRVDAFTALV